MGDAVDPLDGAFVAAILLTLVDDDSAVRLLAPLDAAEIRRLGPAMLAVSNATVPQIEDAIDAFLNRCRESTTIGTDVEARTRSIFSQALGEGRACSVLPSPVNPLDRLRVTLRWLSRDRIIATLRSESPQAAALIVASLDPLVAAEALQELDEARRIDVVLRAARLGTVEASAIEALCRDLETPTDEEALSSVKVDAATGLAKVVAKLPREQSTRLIGAIRKRDRALAERVEDEMFDFGDLAAVPDRDLTTLLRTIDSSVLAMALRGADAKLADRLLGCLSARSAQSLRDDISEAAPAKRADVVEAQRSIIAAARSMANDGTIQLSITSDDYV